MVKNLIGTKVGMLNILDKKRENNRTFYFCECECGDKKWMRADSVKKSCGCLSKKNLFKAEDIKGKKFGRLTAIKITDNKRENGSIFWECECQCGNITYATSTDLKLSRVVSCGCFKKEYQHQQGARIGEKFIEKFIIQDTNLQIIGTDKVNSRNTSGYKGVRWDNSRSKWTASITFQKKYYFLGRFDKKEDAIKARKEAEEKLHKNFIEGLKK